MNGLILLAQVYLLLIITETECMTYRGNNLKKPEYRHFDTDEESTMKHHANNLYECGNKIHLCGQYLFGSTAYMNCLIENCGRREPASHQQLQYDQYLTANLPSDEISVKKRKFDSVRHSIQKRLTRLQPYQSEAFEKFVLNYIGTCYINKCLGMVASVQTAMECVIRNCDTNYLEHMTDYLMLQQLAGKLDTTPEKRDKAFADNEFKPQAKTGTSSVQSYGGKGLHRTQKRINDEVSQCIQSYCGGVTGHRLSCIVKNCHRSQTAGIFAKKD